ncbi:MAG TPA: 4-hydroxythreonine-4-phosphate dehydrogenase PdxA, partial [Gemmatimonadota bacterium]|nr:4-hydroxythreonine-4-phosphate dehydrogenase PdxA [Gemmatimonadota bacterium]
MTLGDPRGIGPEVALAAVASEELRGAARWVLVGPEGLLPSDRVAAAGAGLVSVGSWETEAGDDERRAGALAGAAVERAARMALRGEVDGMVTAPLSKAALAAAGYEVPGHTELLRDLAGVPEVTMIMGAEETGLGGTLRMAFLTGHIPLRDVPGRLTEERVVARTTIAAAALREWWGLERPRLAFAGVNPHASEGGLLGDEEDRVLRPALERLAAGGGLEVDGVHPADTVFRRCLDGRVDAVVVPYH